ncbi:MAG: 16S rRNA (guanine(527)-N(7))-methyltransferase RsmG [Desulfobacterales bacterium]|jgi:16S rRNA (guanine527-N7)-methyltransferase|nr:16S rRNA (guanine(527)-N(7))-methyltransferase RsmG [Deltaproteobacteria bacterium]
MEIGSREWQNLIVDGAQELGIKIDERVSALFASHAAELINWNRKMNLTAITRPRDMAIKHFLDSLVPAELIADGSRLLDIGSGSGFPGIPLRIVKPSLSIHLIDGNRKKVHFLKHVIRTLGLDQSQAFHIRAENLHKNPDYVNFFDVIISRALSNLKSFVKIARPLLAKQGLIVAMKGKVDQDELEMLRSMVNTERYVLETKNYRLPLIQHRRSLITFRSLH